MMDLMRVNAWNVPVNNGNAWTQTNVYIDPICVMDLVNAQTYQMKLFVQQCLIAIHTLFSMYLNILYRWIEEVVFLLYYCVMVYLIVGILQMNKIVETFPFEINFFCVCLSSIY